MASRNISMARGRSKPAANTRVKPLSARASAAPSHAGSVTAATLFEYFGYFYEPFRSDRSFEFTNEYNSASLKMIFKPDGEFTGLQKKLNLPPDFVFVNRIQWGVYSILARLEATGNWHRIHREFLQNAAPSTELGRLDRNYRARWCADRNLAPDSDLIATPQGVRERGIAA